MLGITIEEAKFIPLAKFGLAMVGAGISSVFLANAEKVVLSSVVSVKALAYYSVAFTLASMATMLSSSMIQSLVPAFTQLAKPGREIELRLLFSRCLTLNLIAVVPAIVFLAVIGQDFFTIWAGADFGVESTVPFYFLLMGLFVNIPAYIPYSVLLALGKADVIAKLYWLELLPFLLLVVILTTNFGIIGAAAAWGIRMFFDGILFFWLMSKEVRGRFSVFDGRVIVLCVSFALFLPVLIVATLDFPITWSLAVFAVMIGLYLIFVWFKVLQNEEREWIEHRAL